jgi:hypothetical protein
MSVASRERVVIVGEGGIPAGVAAAPDVGEAAEDGMIPFRPVPGGRPGPRFFELEDERLSDCVRLRFRGRPGPRCCDGSMD